MGLKDFFSRKKEEPKKDEVVQEEVKHEEIKKEEPEKAEVKEEAVKAEETAEPAEGSQPAEDAKKGFVLGVENVFSAGKDSPDLVVTGYVTGTIKVGDEVIITKLGSDTDKPVKSAVYALEDGNNGRVMEASNKKIAAWIENGAQYGLYKGSVVHSEGTSENDLYGTYINAIGESFVGVQNGEISDIDRVYLSVTDVAEIWRLFLWYCNINAAEDTEERRSENMEKIRNLVTITRDKLFLVDEIYAVYSVTTGEPYLFTKTMKKEDGSYYTTAPLVRLIPAAYKENLKEKFEDNDEFELRRIENGPNKDGIRNFLSEVILLDGARGIQFVAEETSIAAEGLIEFPDYEGMREIDIPVTNPDVVRWLHLLGQLGKPDTPDREILFNMYFHHLAEALKTARFIVPMRGHGELPKVDENGNTTFKEGFTFDLAMQDGKEKEKALLFFTDWKRLRKEFGEEWQGLIQQLDGNLSLHDVIINGTGKEEAGAYITESIFNKIKNAE